MINFHLAAPVVLFSQLDELAEKSCIDISLLKKLVNGFCVVTEDVAADTQGEPVSKFSIMDLNTLVKSGKVAHRRGSDAIIWLASEFGVALTPITDIDIPLDVYWECSDRQWLDISYFAAAVESRSRRLDKLYEINAPEIILLNEERMLREKVEILESNRYGKPVVHDEGTLYRSLNDIGYSLIHGWDKGMLDEFERRQEEYQKEMQEGNDSEVAEQEAV